MFARSQQQAAQQSGARPSALALLARSVASLLFLSTHGVLRRLIRKKPESLIGGPGARPAEGCADFRMCGGAAVALAVLRPLAP
jgi:hypothetical protein